MELEVLGGNRIRSAGQYRARPSARSGRGTLLIVFRSDTSELPADSAIVVTNPDEDCSPSAFRELLDEVLSGPEPEMESLDGVAVVRALRG